MLNKLCYLATGAALILAIFSSCTGSSPSDKPNRIQEKLGTAATEIVHHPDAVTAFRVSPNPAASTDRLGPYAKLSSGVTVSAANIAKLQGSLLNDENYEWELLKKNVFVPETAFVFAKSGEEVLVFVSLSSKKVEFHCPSGEIVKIDTDKGQQHFNEVVGKISKDLDRQ